jgi:hypothetical protein
MNKTINLSEWKLEHSGNTVVFTAKNNSLDEFFSLNKNQFQFSEWKYRDGLYLSFSKVELKIINVDSIQDARTVLKSILGL